MNIYLVILLVVVAIVALSFFWTKKQQGEITILLQSQALKREGTVKKGNILYYPRLSFNYRCVEITVSAIPGGGTRSPRGDMTFADFSMRSFPNYRFRVVWRKSTQGLQAMLGAKVNIGNSAFDNAFIVRSGYESFVRNVMTPELQNKLLEYGSKIVHVDFKNHRFAMAIEGIAKTEQDCDRLIETTTMFCERLQGLLSELRGAENSESS